MKVLVACEFSGIVRDAFIKRGHDAISCDLLPTERPGPHIQGDVLEILNAGSKYYDWDLMIAHPPCTHLCVPGAHYLHKQEGRWQKMEQARKFFMQIMNARIRQICVENPVPHHYAKLPKYDQIIQPWMFGHELSKRTCLWLKNIPNLNPTDMRENHGERYVRTKQQQQAGQSKVSNSKWYAKTNAKSRSRTFQGIADAMADQWGCHNGQIMTNITPGHCKK